MSEPKFPALATAPTTLLAESIEALTGIVDSNSSSISLLQSQVDDLPNLYLGVKGPGTILAQSTYTNDPTYSMTTTEAKVAGTTVNVESASQKLYLDMSIMVRLDTPNEGDEYWFVPYVEGAAVGYNTLKMGSVGGTSSQSSHNHSGPSHSHSGPSHTHPVSLDIGLSGSSSGHTHGPGSLGDFASGSGGTGSTGSAGTGNTGNAGSHSHAPNGLASLLYVVSYAGAVTAGTDSQLDLDVYGDGDSANGTVNRVQIAYTIWRR